jgi:predicted enzyme related to lactoylglutathione lyase
MNRMITAVHALMYSRQSEQVRAFFRDVLEWPHVDDGNGWLIFAMPPSELAVHPTENAPTAELYLMCDDIDATIEELKAKGVATTGPVTDQGWGLVTSIAIADGETLGLYQPRHKSPLNGAEPFA